MKRVEYLKQMIAQEREALSKCDNEDARSAIQRRLDSLLQDFKQVEIKEIIRLTPEQEQLCKEMEALYKKMEAAGIAFAENEDAEVVAYNATEIEDCERFDVWGDSPDDYEYVEQNDMRRLFPVWGCETLFVKRKTE